MAPREQVEQFFDNHGGQVLYTTTDIGVGETPLFQCTVKCPEVRVGGRKVEACEFKATGNSKSLAEETASNMVLGWLGQEDLIQPHP
jgi:hypothetical protein